LRRRLTPPKASTARSAFIEVEELESWDDLGLIAEILEHDAERVAAAGR
jgi:hypothetical protein